MAFRRRSIKCFLTFFINNIVLNIKGCCFMFPVREIQRKALFGYQFIKLIPNLSISCRFSVSGCPSEFTFFTKALIALISYNVITVQRITENVVISDCSRIIHTILQKGSRSISMININGTVIIVGVDNIIGQSSAIGIRPRSTCRYSTHCHGYDCQHQCHKAFHPLFHALTSFS